jgi:hypothetical protein
VIPKKEVNHLPHRGNNLVPSTTQKVQMLMIALKSLPKNLFTYLPLTLVKEGRRWPSTFTKSMNREVGMKGTNSTGCDTVSVSSTIVMAGSTKENGNRTKWMDLRNFTTRMGRSPTKVTGVMISSTAEERSSMTVRNN